MTNIIKFLEDEAWMMPWKASNFEYDVNVKYNKIIVDIVETVKQGNLSDNNVYFLLDQKIKELSDSSEDLFVKDLIKNTMNKLYVAE